MIKFQEIFGKFKRFFFTLIYIVLFLDFLKITIMYFILFCRQKALRALSEHLNKAERPRVVGTVTPQKSVNRFPKENVVSPVSDPNIGIPGDTQPSSSVLTANESKGPASFVV